MQSGTRSYYATSDFKSGDLIKPGMFIALRPYVKKSVSCEKFFVFLKKKLKKGIKKNEVLKPYHIE